MLKCKSLRCEYFKNPIGIDIKKPRFSWKIESEQKNTMQEAYQIIVEDMWDTGKVESDSSIWNIYSGKPLLPQTRYTYKVRVWDNFGNVSDFEEGYFETGIDKWQGNFICGPSDYGNICPVYERKIRLVEKVKSARIYATAYGVYEININGKKVGDTYFAPGFTVYPKRLQYQAYDVTDMIDGDITVSIEAGKCWFMWYGNKIPSVLAEIHITYENGEKEIIVTDESWTVKDSRIRYSHLYHGEHVDCTAKIGPPKPVRVLDIPKDNIIAQESEPVRITEEIKPVEIIKTPKGETVIDFGQNLVGWDAFKIKGKRGDKVEITHAEVLDKDGNFYSANYRGADSPTRFILSGEEEEYHARFTFFGFRYIRLDEYPEEPKLENFKALVLHTDMEFTGDFKCSNELVNRLYQNTVWGQRGNFLDIPTDCPQRDERLGWTGDAQVFAPSAARNMNVSSVFYKWLRDVEAEQTEENGATQIVPDVWWDDTSISSGWGDAAVICPFEMYRAYADKGLLEKQYNSMKTWVSYIRRQGDNEFLWNTGFHYGDWVAIDAKEGSYTGSTSKDFIASAYYSYSVKLLAKTAKILGKEEDRAEYEELYNNIVSEIQKEFITNNGRLVDNTQTAHAIALVFGLATNKNRTAETLAELIRENNFRLTTGFLGTPCLCRALSDNGYDELAYTLLLNEDYPSWLYTVKKGATTMWEHWDGINEYGDFWDEKMNSFNHYAYGAIADWMFGTAAGINIDENAPAYKHSIIRPVTDERLDFVEGTIETPYGRLFSRWEKTKEGIKYTVTIPPNTTAEFVYPDGVKEEIGSGTYTFNYN